MNKQRRNKLQDILERLEEIRAELEEIIQQEEEAIENLPDNLQSSEKHDLMQEAADNLETSVADITSAMDFIEEIVNS